MSADVGPVLPEGITVVSRGPAPDPAIVDGRGLLRPQGREGRSGGILPAHGADKPADGRVARATLCPECRDGKHPVCADYADVTEDDEFLPCLCPCREDAP